MKKQTKILLILSVIVSCVFATSCQLMERVSELMGPKDQFFEYEYEYDYSDSQKIYLTCYLLYTDSGCKKSKSGTEIRYDPGLTICAIPSTKTVNNASLIQEVFGEAMDNLYIKKTFNKGESIDLAGINNAESGKFQIGYATWAIIYNSVPMNPCGTSLPGELINRSSIDDPAKFNWKKLMYAIAINKLVDLSNAVN